MEENMKKYEIIINSSVNMLVGFSLIGIIVLGIIFAINCGYEIPKAWNISFLIPVLLLFFSTMIQVIICFWKVGNVDNVEKICKRKSRLIFSSCITFIVFISSVIMYSLMSIILFH